MVRFGEVLLWKWVWVEAVKENWTSHGAWQDTKGRENVVITASQIQLSRWEVARWVLSWYEACVKRSEET